MQRVGIDVGGTFTDLIFVDDESGRLVYHKVPSTPDDPSEGMIRGLLELCGRAEVAPVDVSQLFHGTTVPINTVIQRSGAHVGMITTHGFRDIIQIGRHKRPVTYSLQFELPHQKYPLVRRRDRVAVRERVIPPHGEVLEPLDEEGVRAAVEQFRRDGVDAVAICFLWSFLNPVHEARARDIVRELMPDTYVCTSHDVLSQFREFERFSTTALNAYIAPRVTTYIENTVEQLNQHGFEAELHLMQSSGGMSTAAAARRKPVTLAMSGPVAGLLAAVWLAQEEGFENIVTLDVGGTSSDIGIARAGEVRYRQLMESKIGDYAVALPMIDIDAIGAGGGSIAYLDAVGQFRVGPRSAGADPGPACYGQGGTNATSTDASLLLGRLDPDHFLGGRMTLHPDLAREAILSNLGQLGLSPEEIALGVLKVQVSDIVAGIEINSVKRGYDPREMALMAFGGAGPLFAADVAMELGIMNVVVPPAPGITSAFGLLATDVRYEYSRSDLQDFAQVLPEPLNDVFMRLEEEARQQLESDGFHTDVIELTRIADCRYAGQAYELRVPLRRGDLDSATVENLLSDFHAVHERTYGVRLEGKPVQLVNVRLVARGVIPRFSLPTIKSGASDPNDALRYQQDLLFHVDGDLKQLATPRYDRTLLAAGNVITGPAIVDQADSTIVIPPECVARVSHTGSLVLTIPVQTSSLDH